MAEKTRNRTKLRTLVRVCVWSLVVVIIAVVVANNTVAKLPAMPAADGKYISLRGKDIHYIEQAGQGIPVVEIHGLPGTCKDFDPVLPDLQGRHVIAIDRPGFGWSKGGWLPYQDQIDVVHEFLTQLHLAPAILVGHSFGGTLALGVARRYPQDVAKLILAAPGAGGLRSTPMDKFNAYYAKFSELPVVAPVLDFTANDVFRRVAATAGVDRAFAPGDVDPGYKQRLLAVSMTSGNLAAFASDQLAFDDTSRWLDENVPAIRVPSVIIGAADDHLVPIEHARRLADTLPGSQLVTVDGSHMIPYTHPDVIAAQVKGADPH
ncbi:alpha/beta hydrolase [Mycolicibacterium moriokaense]|nr:alpha/beta hydrolase [Mycolicibacterium moriokaense]